MLIGVRDAEFVLRIEIVIDLEIDLVPIDVVLQTLLAADQAVSTADPSIYSRIQTIAAVLEIIRKRHARDHALNVTGLIEARS